MDTLALTLAAVLLSADHRHPARHRRGPVGPVNRPVSLVLDFMQTMPSFVYLAPLDAVLPHRPGVRDDRDADLRDAADDPLHRARDPERAGDDGGGRRRRSARRGGSRLTGVLLPLARPTIVLGINQTIMAALAMVTIAALIDAPGLGKIVLKALTTLDVGTAFNAGLAIVVLAIVLDRMTTAFSRRAEISHRRPPSALAARLRRPLLIAGAVGDARSRCTSPAPTCGRRSSRTR